MSRQVITAAPNDTVIEVIERMKQHDISQLPVMANGVPSGLISEVDLLNYMVLGKQRISDPVGPLASEELFTVSPDISVEQLAEKFALDRRPAAAVVRDGRLVGMLTKIDIIDFLAKKFRSASS
jgi:cystathionine beta-synthase